MYGSIYVKNSLVFLGINVSNKVYIINLYIEFSVKKKLVRHLVATSPKIHFKSLM